MSRRRLGLASFKIEHCYRSSRNGKPTIRRKKHRSSAVTSRSRLALTKQNAVSLSDCIAASASSRHTALLMNQPKCSMRRSTSKAPQIRGLSLRGHCETWWSISARRPNMWTGLCMKTRSHLQAIPTKFRLAERSSDSRLILPLR